MKGNLKYFMIFYFKKIFYPAVFIAIITFLLLLIIRKISLDIYLNGLFFEGGGLLVLSFFFSLRIGRASWLKMAFYYPKYPASAVVNNIKKDWKMEVSISAFLSLLGLTLLALLFSIYGLSLLLKRFL